jgi:hypothetical protein
MGRPIAACAVDRPFDLDVVLRTAWLFVHVVGPLVESAKVSPADSRKRHAKLSQRGTLLRCDRFDVSTIGRSFIAIRIASRAAINGALTAAVE